MISERTPQFPPLISPLREAGENLLWSIMIPTYNCSKYLRETLESVLQQDTGRLNMQIEVVDDCSTDGDVKNLVQVVGKGRISFFAHEQNVGSLRNFETCINRSRGKLIHILHGDDKVKPGFYLKIEKLFAKYPLIGAALTGLSVIDEQGAILYPNNLIQNDEGIIEDWLLKIAKKQLLQVCCIVVRRSVYERLGSFYKIHYGEDWEMWTRIAANYPVAYSPDNLALYRHHNNSISTRYLSTGQNIKDIKTVIEIIQNYLPLQKRKEIKKISRKNYSIYITGDAQEIFKKHGNIPISLKQAFGALLMDVNKTTVTSFLKLVVKIML